MPAGRNYNKMPICQSAICTQNPPPTAPRATSDLRDGPKSVGADFRRKLADYQGRRPIGLVSPPRAPFHRPINVAATRHDDDHRS